MTRLQLDVNVPDGLAREARAAGLLTSQSISRLLRAAVRQRAGQRLLAAATRAQRAGSRPLSMQAIQREVDAVRTSSKKTVPTKRR